MNVKHLPISVRTRCSKFTLMKKDTKDSKVQFFKQGTVMHFQPDFDYNVKTRQTSKTKSIQKDKSMGMPRKDNNNSSKEKNAIKTSLNSQLMKLFKQLDSIKRKNVVSTNRTTYYEKSIEKKKEIKKNNVSIKEDDAVYPLHYQNHINANGTTISSHNNSINFNCINMVSVKAKSKPQKKFKPNKQLNHNQKDKKKQKQKQKQKQNKTNVDMTLQSYTKQQEQMHIRKNSCDIKNNEQRKTSSIIHNNNTMTIPIGPISNKERIKDKVIKTFHPFHIGYMKPAKPNQSMRSANASKILHINKSNKINKFMYLSTNQSHMNTNPISTTLIQQQPKLQVHSLLKPQVQHQMQPKQNINRTIEQLYPVRPLSSATEIKYVNTTDEHDHDHEHEHDHDHEHEHDNYGFNNENDQYESDSDEINHNGNDSDDDDDDNNSGVLAYDDVKDIIIYNDFEEVDIQQSTLFETMTYDDYISNNKERILMKFFDNSNSGNANNNNNNIRGNLRMSPSTNESSHNKRNYVNVIKHSE